MLQTFNKRKTIAELWKKEDCCLVSILRQDPVADAVTVPTTSMSPP
jgi:hypothetical protein